MLVHHFKHQARKYSREASGSTALAFALALPVVLGITAMAADVGNAYLQEEKLKQLTESVALSALLKIRDNQVYGATTNTDRFKPGLVTFAKTNMQTAAKGVAIGPQDIEFGNWNFANQTFTPTKASESATAARVKGYMSADRGNQLPTFFGKIFLDSFDISVKSVAVLPFPPDFHVLSEMANRALIFDDSDIDTFRMVVNSTAPNALSLPGSARTMFGTHTVTVAGGIRGSHAGKGQARGQVEVKVPGLADFLENQPSPRIDGCMFNNHVAKPVSKKIVVKPGIYCGGLRIDAPARNVEFRPGVYIIKDGPLLIQDQKKVKGDRVFLFLTGKKGGLNIKNSRVSLRAKRTGKWAGMTIMSDRRKKFAPKDHFVTGGNLVSVGTIYLPASALVVNSGNLRVSCRGVCVAANTMEYRDTKISGHNQYKLSSLFRFPGNNQAVAPVGLEVSFRPYLVEQNDIPLDTADPG